VYVAGVTLTGGALVAWLFPERFPQPILFATLVAMSCLTSVWKVTLPLSLGSGSTLSVSYAADLMALLMLGPSQAMLVAAAGVWTQCTFRVKRSYPPYRTVFSIAAEVITIQATGVLYAWLGGSADAPHPVLPGPLVGAICTYFAINTGLVAMAIALSTRQRAWKVWQDNFLWSGPSFMVAGGAGGMAAAVIMRGDHWLALLMMAPVYLTYRTYQVFLGRIEDERRHAEETEKLHGEAIEALLQARRAEQALADEKERLAVALRSVGDGVITTDLDGTITLLNNVAETLTGWTQDEALGRSLDTVFQSVDPETRARCDNSVGTLSWHGGHPSLGRSTVLVARDLSERPIEEIGAPLRNSAGRTIGMVLAFRDITDALRVQEERARASKVESLGLLAGGIAHDFNNILMAIMGNLSMAQVAVPTGGPAARALAEAQQACARATQLTWRLLTFSRGGVPSKKETNIGRVLKESAGPAVRGSNVSCVFDIAPDLWPVAADERQIGQVIAELVTNAQQAMPHGGFIRIHAENVVEPDRRWENALRVEAGRYVRVSVTDNGIGIPEENLGRVFDPYFTTKQKGSGLGLATSHSILKQHGGLLSAQSTLGRGTTIHMSLPASVDRDLPLVEPSAMGAGTGRVLLMDDEPLNRRVAANMLEFLGHDVEIVDNANEAVERYAAAFRTGRPFDAVMLDLVMNRGIGGRETLERLTQVDPAVKAVVVSAQAPAQAGLRDDGCKAFIAKPFTLQELNTALHTVMAPGSLRVH
jgi:PAS domain S-box-containing protein